MKKKIILALLPLSIFAVNFNPQMQSYIDSLKVEAKKANSSFVDFNKKRGEQIFNKSHIGKKGEPISCSSCHNVNLKLNGKNIHTNKILEPLAPSVNSKRLTEVKGVKKWLRRNFKDVYVREGSALEKGDVLYFINSK